MGACSGAEHGQRTLPSMARPATRTVSVLATGTLRRAADANFCGLSRRREKEALPFVSSERPEGEIGSITTEAIHIGIGGVENR